MVQVLSENPYIRREWYQANVTYLGGPTVWPSGSPVVDDVQRHEPYFMRQSVLDNSYPFFSNLRRILTNYLENEETRLNSAADFFVSSMPAGEGEKMDFFNALNLVARYYGVEFTEENLEQEGLRGLIEDFNRKIIHSDVNRVLETALEMSGLDKS